MLSENVVVRELTFIWKIENFSLCPQTEDEDIVSPVFTPEDSSSSRWYLKLYPRGHSTAEGWISCFLYKDGADIGADEISLRIEIIDTDGRPLLSKEMENYEIKTGNGCGWFNFVEIQELRDKREYLSGDVLTIRCRLTMSETRKEMAIECRARTKIRLDRGFFKWNVKCSDSYDWSENRTVLLLDNSTKFEVTLTGPQDYIRIEINAIEGENSGPRFMICKISLLDAKEAVRKSMISEHWFSGNANWKFPSFIRKSHLKADANIFLKDNSFTLKFDLSYSNGIELDEVEGYKYSTPGNSEPKVDTVAVLQEDLRRLYANGIQSDVKLRVGNETFPAHKLILSARSPVFSAMFQHSMSENKTGIADIVDLDSQTMNSLLEFMYTGAVNDLDYESALKLLIAADKYQVLSLKEKCAEFLPSVLSDENASEVFIYADMVGHENLKASSTDYIKAHPNSLLSEEFLQCILNCSESEVLSKLSVTKESVIQNN